jgi:two-component system OmpR family response regulator
MVSHAPLSECILIVDDDDDIRDLIASHRSRRIPACRGATLAEARAALTRHDIALMLLDLTLPDGDGMTFCRDLRAEGFVVAIIMLTARSTPATAWKGSKGRRRLSLQAF